MQIWAEVVLTRVCALAHKPEGSTGTKKSIHFSFALYNVWIQLISVDSPFHAVNTVRLHVLYPVSKTTSCCLSFLWLRRKKKSRQTLKAHPCQCLILVKLTCHLYITNHRFASRVLTNCTAHDTQINHKCSVSVVKT